MSLQQLLTTACEQGEIHGASYGVAERGTLKITGSAGTVAEIYDVASLTKPLVTGLLTALLAERGELDLEQKVAHYLPEFALADKHDIRLWHLATHSSGFPAWRPFYILAAAPADVVRVIAQTPLSYPTGSRVVYSDLGFITLGKLLERIAGQSLPSLFAQEVTRPLGLNRTGFNPPPEWHDRIAPTETGNQHERDLCRKIEWSPVEAEKVAAYQGWRTTEIQGVVHDGNAWFLNGAAGHAGLFSTVPETFRLASQFLPGSQLLKQVSFNLFTQNRTPGLEEDRSWSWMLASTKDSTAGPALPSQAFGHTGFAGTSLWIDPVLERIYILLANRTYPIRNLNHLRRAFHAQALQEL
ncbi:MAG: beta-lactamase family protein [Blastocatellia bacterium]|nr:beta-lactamase family protein [Blastocatellia bacterium]